MLSIIWRRLLFFTVGLFCSGAIGVVYAQTMKIAAVVNNEVITTYDLGNRIDFVIATSGETINKEMRDRITSGVLHQLINEHLQMQEAKAKKIMVSDSEVRSMIEEVEKNNNIPSGTIDSIIAKLYLPKEVIENQFRARIAWEKLLVNQKRSEVVVSDEEVDRALNETQSNRDKMAHRVSEIVIGIDSTQTESSARAVAEGIVTRVRDGGNFLLLAQQLSIGNTAINGGNLGWVAVGQLDRVIEEALAALEPGQVTDPVRMPNGYYVLLLHDRRKFADVDSGVKVDFSQILMPFTEADVADERDVVRAAQTVSSVASKAKSCDDLARLGNEANLIVPPRSGLVDSSSLLPILQQMAETLEVGHVSKPVRLQGAVAVYMLCQREKFSSKLPSREQIRHSLFVKRLNAVGHRYLRDLKIASYIDIRI